MEFNIKVNMITVGCRSSGIDFRDQLALFIYKIQADAIIYEVGLFFVIRFEVLKDTINEICFIFKGCLAK